MPSRIPPGSSVVGRMDIYRRLMTVPALQKSYARKFAVAAFVGTQVPLLVFIAYLLFARADWSAMFPLVAALILACFAGFLGTLWVLREILVPIDLTAEALKAYLEERRLPDLPVEFPDQAGRLMEGTQYTLTQLNETINRLERVSDSDDLTGLYNRRAGEKRLAEEIARGERDLEAFHFALVEVNDLRKVIEANGHSAGDACLSHVAALLQLNTRRGDWVARWEGNSFAVGLHRNRSLKMVVERIARAMGASPCEVAPGREVGVSVCVGVAEYRFGAGKAGLVGDTERALSAARDRFRQVGGSHVAFYNELGTGAPLNAAA